MADLEPNFTMRYRFRYSVGGKSHSTLFRFNQAVSTADAVVWVADFLEIVKPLLYTDFTVLSAEYAERYSDVFLPVEAPQVTGTLGASVASDTARVASWTGRAMSGKKVVVRLAGVYFDQLQTTQRDFRLSVAESEVVANSLLVLAQMPIVAPDGNEEVFWNQYMNVSFSAYWQRKLRG